MDSTGNRNIELKFQVAIPKDMFIGWSNEQIEKYIYEMLNNAAGLALKETINEFTMKLLKGESSEEPVGILG